MYHNRITYNEIEEIKNEEYIYVIQTSIFRIIKQYLLIKNVEILPKYLSS